MPKTKKTYQLKLPGQSDVLEIVRDFVTRIAHKIGIESAEIDKIELAVDEACANVVKHAYAVQNSKRKAQPLEVSVTVDPKQFVIVVSDKGKGFDYSKHKSLDMEQYRAEKKRGGLGIHLMRTLMDEIEYSIEPGKKNEVKLIKYISD